MNSIFRFVSQFVNFGFVALLALALALVPISGCNTTWVAQVEQYLPVAFNAANGIIAILQSTGVLAAADSTAAQAVENQITSDFTLLCGATPGQPCAASSLIGEINAGTSTGTNVQKLVAVLSDIQTNLSAILTSLHVTNAKTSSTISAAVDLALSLISEIQAVVPIAVAAAASGKTPNVKFSRSAKQYKKEFKSIFTNGGFAFAAAK